MKRLIALVAALALLAAFLPAAAEPAEETKSPLAETVEALTYLHFDFVSMMLIDHGLYKNEEEAFYDIVLLELIDHHYDCPAYRTRNNVWDALFIPDSSGDKVQSVRLLADITTLSMEYEDYLTVLYHVEGLASPFWDFPNLGSFGKDFGNILLEAYFSTGTYETQKLDMTGVSVCCFHNGNTLGINLDFPKAVSQDDVLANPYVQIIISGSSGSDE